MSTDPQEMNNVFALVGNNLFVMSAARSFETEHKNKDYSSIGEVEMSTIILAKVRWASSGDSSMESPPGPQPPPPGKPISVPNPGCERCPSDAHPRAGLMPIPGKERCPSDGHLLGGVLWILPQDRSHRHRECPSRCPSPGVKDAHLMPIPGRACCHSRAGKMPI